VWLLWLLLGPVWAQPVTVRVDFRQTQGPFVRMSGVQGSPYPMAPGDVDHSQAFRDHHLQLCRFPQDCPPNRLTLSGIFPDEEADPEDPKSYRFEQIDRHILAARKAGCQILWQASYDIGQSDSWKGLNLGGRAPRNMARWCRVVHRCLEHFNNGWAQGHRGCVSYVEFVNEPDGLGGFTGAERKRLGPCFVQFLRAIKKYNQIHPDTPVQAVGPGVPLSWDQWQTYQLPTQRLLEMLKNNQVELPIFSFHTYGEDTSPGANQKLARAFRQLLDAHGMQSTRLWNTEWQATDHIRKQLGDRRPSSAQSITPQLQSLYQGLVAAYALACKIRWQGVVDASCYYIGVRRCFPPTDLRPRLDLAIFFPPQAAPTPLAQQEKLLAQGSGPLTQRVSTSVTPEDDEISALGLSGPQGWRLLLSNPSTRARKLSLVLQLPRPLSALRLHWRQPDGSSASAEARGQSDLWQWEGELDPATSAFVQLEAR